MAIRTDQYANSLTVVDTVTANAPLNLIPQGTGAVTIPSSAQNLMIRSVPTSGVWSTFTSGVGGVAPTVTYNAVAAPDSTTTAAQVVYPGNTTTNISVVVASNSVTLLASTYTASIFLRGNVGGEVIYLIIEDNTNFRVQACTLTTTWQRYSVSGLCSAGTNYFVIGGWQTATGATSACTYFMWGAQLEFSSTMSPFVPTSGTAIYNPPNLTFNGVAGVGLQLDGSLYHQPAGTGAVQAQATTSSATGGNARGANAVDWQTARSVAANVASGSNSIIGGGNANTSSTSYASVFSGLGNTASGVVSLIAGGQGNVASGNYSSIVGGVSNTSSGWFNFVGGGFQNSATANAAVTTQSATMNATTAVTLSGSNANIKVGQYITGTSIAGDTYVAAISGTSLTLSKVASGSSTSTLSFFTPHGVVVGGGNNQATGSYSFIGGGGDAGTAGNRNVASGDWSTVGGGRTNIASNLYAVISGGNNNTASGQFSSVLGGGFNQALGFGSSVAGGFANYSNATYSQILNGQYGTARGIESNFVISSSAPLGGSSGLTQSAILIIAVQTTDATATVLRCNTSAASTTNQVILPNNSAYFFTGEVVAGVTGGGNTKGWTIEGVIKRGANAAATTLVGSTVTSMYADVGAAAWTIALSADTTNGGLAVTFTGQLATTIRCVAQIRTTEMTF